MTKENLLAHLAARIKKDDDCWLFPSERIVRGFLGTAPLFIVGDQPSMSEWPETNPNRRAFYDLLARIGAADAHVTDLYKKRGRSSALKDGVLPSDFSEHVLLFREELAALEPSRVVALGDLAFQLLTKHVPEVVPKLTYIWHFAYAQRYGRIAEWEEMARLAISAPVAVAPKPGSRGTTPPSSTRREAHHVSTPPSNSSQFAVTYQFSRLCFKADLIEPLKLDQAFCVVTPVGTFVMTKREFYENFPNVLSSQSYRVRKIYHYPTLPQKALPFKVK